MKGKVVLVHFRKAGAPKGFPWTVHYAGQCIPATTVKFEVPCVTVFKPEKKTNPRAWMRAIGVVTIDGRTYKGRSPTVHVTIASS